MLYHQQWLADHLTLVRRTVLGVFTLASSKGYPFALCPLEKKKGCCNLVKESHAETIPRMSSPTGTDRRGIVYDSAGRLFRPSKIPHCYSDT